MKSQSWDEFKKHIDQEQREEILNTGNNCHKCYWFSQPRGDLLKPGYCNNAMAGGPWGCVPRYCYEGITCIFWGKTHEDSMEHARRAMKMQDEENGTEDGPYILHPQRD